MLDQLLSPIESDQNISDILISAGSPLVVRKNGDIVLTSIIVTQGDIESICKEIEQQAMIAIKGNKEYDCTYHSSGGYYYRINVFLKQGLRALAMRKIAKKTWDLEGLMIPSLATTLKKHILSASGGLFLVTGVAGSGKSTTLNSCLEYINTHNAKHIITIEDPIEFVYQSKKSVFSQRQVEHDTVDFTSGLKSLLRQNPDIVLVGEIRDRESAEAVLTIAETGHLVLSTLHTKSASSTLSRFISFFPPLVQDAIRDRLADVFLGSLAQQLTLLPSHISINEQNSNILSNHFERVALYELILNTMAVSNSIRKGDFKQIPSLIQTGKSDGMITMEEYGRILCGV